MVTALRLALQQQSELTSVHSRVLTLVCAPALPRQIAVSYETFPQFPRFLPASLRCLTSKRADM